MREEGCSRNQLHVMMHGKPHGSYMEGELPKAETHKNGKANPNSEGDVSRTRRPSTVMISGKGKKDLCVLCACVCCAYGSKEAFIKCIQCCVLSCLSGCSGVRESTAVSGGCAADNDRVMQIHFGNRHRMNGCVGLVGSLR